ncbi:hypothetical protein G7054_g8886 [Neopestalotiopsis clavispora]|nr:hypothetical protein G7054_g8886 [Neopestalotiopsis clavispora]
MFSANNLAPPTRRPRANSHGMVNKILVEPTPEKQSHYNHIRDEEERNQKNPRDDEERHQRDRHLQQHIIAQNRLSPSNLMAPPMARSITGESQISTTSLSPGSTAETQEYHNPATEASSATGRRPRGRRGGPLKHDKRFKTAIKRKLGYVCDRCKVKKVSCDHYDFSKYEEAYQAQRNATRAESQRLGPAVPDLFGLEGGPAPTPSIPKVEDLASDLNGYPTQTHNRQEHIDHLGNFVDTFNLSNVNFNNHNTMTNTYASTFDQSYSPGLTSSGPSSEITSSVDGPIPIGSEIFISPSTWKCEHKGLGLNVGSSLNVYMPENPCSWTGSKEELQQHFALQHSAFLDANYCATKLVVVDRGGDAYMQPHRLSPLPILSP